MAGKLSVVVETAKSLMLPAEGFVTSTSSTVTASPAETCLLSGTVAPPLDSAAPVATKYQPWLASVTRIPVTCEKSVFGSEKKMSSPMGTAVAALKLIA